MTADRIVRPGLEGVVAAQTRLSSVDGEAGELIIGGFPVETLASQAAFEETVYLLLEGALPNARQLTAFRGELGSRRACSPEILRVLQIAAAQKIPAMDLLRMAVGILALGTDGETSIGDDANAALKLVAVFPTIVAGYARLLGGLEPVPPRADLSHAANYLYMLFGRAPSPDRVRAMETYLNTVVDHGLNASTFAARVIISTQSDLISSIVCAILAPTYWPKPRRNCMQRMPTRNSTTSRGTWNGRSCGCLRNTSPGGKYRPTWNFTRRFSCTDWNFQPICLPRLSPSAG